MIIQKIKNIFKTEDDGRETASSGRHPLETTLDYQFKDIQILVTALSHKSYVHESRSGIVSHNERLEFLGDAVLNLVVSDALMKELPASREGELSKIRASLVNEEILSQVARSIELGKHLFLGRGEEQDMGREKNSLLADALEAMIGAVYLDGGFVPAYQFISKQFVDLISKAVQGDLIRDYKTRLQELFQKNFKIVPEYRLVDQTGPEHDRTFIVGIFVKQRKLAEGQGKSKKQAEQSAARLLISNWQEDEIKIAEYLKS